MKTLPPRLPDLPKTPDPVRAGLVFLHTGLTDAGWATLAAVARAVEDRHPTPAAIQVDGRGRNRVNEQLAALAPSVVVCLGVEAAWFAVRYVPAYGTAVWSTDENGLLVGSGDGATFVAADETQAPGPLAMTVRRIATPDR